MPSSAPGLLGRKLHLFTGKGGVGKSTVVTAFGLALARAGRRPIVVELGHRASIESVLGCAKVGYAPVDVGGGLHAMNMDLHGSIADYVGAHLGARALGRVVLRSRTLRRFFEAAPGVAEVATLHRLRALLGDEAASGFDPVLVDLDATGHARMFFELPRVFAEIAEGGPIRRLLDRIGALLRDPGTTALHLVTSPSELPVHETVELYRDLVRDPVVELGALVVNALPREPLEPATARAVLDAPPGPHDADVALARRALVQHRRAEALAAEAAASIPLPLVRLPRLAGRHPTRADLVELGEALVRGMARGGGAR